MDKETVQGEFPNVMWNKTVYPVNKGRMCYIGYTVRSQWCLQFQENLWVSL